MLTLLKRLLSYLHGEQNEASMRTAGRGRGSATSHLFSKDSPALRQSGEPPKPASTQAPRRPKPQVNPDFDPYNTGKFDRGASWERISKKQR